MFLYSDPRLQRENKYVNTGVSREVPPSRRPLIAPGLCPAPGLPPPTHRGAPGGRGGGGCSRWAPFAVPASPSPRRPLGLCSVNDGWTASAEGDRAVRSGPQHRAGTAVGEARAASLIPCLTVAEARHGAPVCRAQDVRAQGSLSSRRSPQTVFRVTFCGQPQPLGTPVCRQASREFRHKAVRKYEAFYCSKFSTFLTENGVKQTKRILLHIAF